MNYDNLKECYNCGKYATSLSGIGYCPSCQQIEDHTPDFETYHCPHCERGMLPFFEGDIWICEYCGEEVDL